MKKLLIILVAILSLIILAGCGEKEPDGIITLYPGNDTVELGTIWQDGGAKVTIDNVDYDMTTNDTVDPTRTGIYEIHYSYIDQSDEYNTTRYVVVVDQTPPTVTLRPGIDTIKVGEEWIDAWVDFTDNANEPLIPVVTGSVDNTTPGTYEIIYTLTDYSGNSTSVTRYVTVVD